MSAMKTTMRIVLVLLTLLLTAALNAAPKQTFNVVEATIPEMQAALKSGRLTSHDLVMLYLARIATYEDKLHAAITVNPKALEEADALDRERKAGHLRGPLHGIPIAIKDNINTTFMPTTGGALAFDGYTPPYDATVTKNLRDAGAIIIAKTQMTELANWVAASPGPMPNNYNAENGYGYNPYDPRRDPREATFDGRPALNTGGSSSGAGTAASFWAASVGTETSGSILSPSNANMLAGIKPTVGRISRYGIIPITADQDTAGPMARTVTDAAILFGVLEGKASDPNDPATTKCASNGDYTTFLKKDGLKGARIGIPRAYFYEKTTVPGEKEPVGGLNEAQAKVMAEAIAVLKAQGAVIVDPANIPSVVDQDEKSNSLQWGVCTDMDEMKEGKCSVDLAYGMERDFNAYLKSLGPTAPVKTLTELRAWNVKHQKAGAIKYGQSILDFSDMLDLDTFKARYETDRARDIYLTATHGVDEVMKANQLEAILFPGPWGASLGARPGYPTVIVPFGMIPNEPKPAFPEGFNAKPTPFGVSFTAGACSEPMLLKLAFAFEQATKKRVAPLP